MSISKRGSKVKLTLSIEEEILNRSKEVSDEKHIPLSRLIENFLRFFNEPHVYCFKCGEKFDSDAAELCPKCGWMKCPNCRVCRCGLDDETAVAVFHMRRVYEDLLVGRVKEG